MDLCLIIRSSTLYVRSKALVWTWTFPIRQGGTKTQGICLGPNPKPPNMPRGTTAEDRSDFMTIFSPIRSSSSAFALVSGGPSRAIIELLARYSVQSCHLSCNHLTVTLRSSKCSQSPGSLASVHPPVSGRFHRMATQLHGANPETVLR